MTDPGDVDLDRSLDDPPPEEPPRVGRVPVVITLVAVALVATAGVWWFRRSPAEAPASLASAPVTESRSGPPPASTRASELPAEAPVEDLSSVELPELDASDETVRRLVGTLTARPALERWLESSELIRTLVVVVENVAEGSNPAQRLGFLRPDRRMIVREVDDRLVLDPASYARYDEIAGVIGSLDGERVVQVYRVLEPLIQRAYEELGHPDGDPEEVVEQAIARLLEAPVVEGDVLLEPRASLYEFLEPSLEALHPVQKQLLGMGPDNVRQVQRKLREIASALGIPATRLPRPLTHRTAAP